MAVAVRRPLWEGYGKVGLNEKLGQEKDMAVVERCSLWKGYQ